MTPLFTFLFILLLTAFPASAQTNGHRMKLVFPFGEGTNKSICPTDYRTLDGCCEPPNSMYTHSKRVGCCRTPNFTQTFGENTRCCTPEGTGQTRWGQTKDEPCGQFCSLPSTMSYVGAYSSCCAPLPAGQDRWGQTTSSVCGGYCPPTTHSVYDYNGLTSCCPTCDETTRFQSVGNVCGTCCSRIPESCGNAGVRVCEPDTGSAYCSSDITKCNPPTDWIAGTSGEGGFTCCPPCNGVRYAHTTSICGECCNTGNDGYYVSDNTCLFKNRPNDYCSWTAGQWYCSACYRNNVFYAASACVFDGASANATCTAKETQEGGGNYLCRKVSETSLYTFYANDTPLCEVGSKRMCISLMVNKKCWWTQVNTCTAGMGDCITAANPTYHNNSAYCADAQCKTYNAYYSCSTSYWYD